MSTSIVYSGQTPLWNFSETTAFPVTLQQGNSKPTVHVYLSPYTASELKDLLKKAVSGYRREKSDVEIVKEDSAIYSPLVDKHFIKLGNATGTPDAQKAWLDKHPEVKPAIVEHTFGGLQMDRPEAEDTDDSILDIGMELSGQVKVYQDLFDEVNGAIIRVNMIHNFTHPTERQYREYRSARRSKFLRKSTLWTITEQHGTLEKLYDEVVTSIDGAAVAGNACDNTTKSTWIGAVPLWHKLWIVDQIFGEIVEKNA